MTQSRPGKLTHVQTLFWEIDALRYTASRLDAGSQWERWTMLESFLLHFRNLIEFFGKDPDRDNLSVLAPEKFWTDPELQDKLRALNRPDLWEKYEGSKKQDKISRYLQHCTEQRLESKNWDVEGMLRDIVPLIDGFENLAPSKDRSWGPPMKPLSLSNASYSIATIGSGYAAPNWNKK